MTTFFKIAVYRANDIGAPFLSSLQNPEQSNPECPVLNLGRIEFRNQKKYLIIIRQALAKHNNWWSKVIPKVEDNIIQNYRNGFCNTILQKSKRNVVRISNPIKFVSIPI